MNIPRPALVLVAFFACSICSLAQRPSFGSHGPMSGSPFDSQRRDTGSITGTVQNTQNKPMKDVRVELIDGNGAVIGSTYTNTSGNFEFTSVASGTYTVLATAGLQQTSERLDASGWNNVVSLRMPTSDQPADGVNGNAISVAQYKVPGKARDEYRKAHDALQKEKIEDAGKHLAKALEICPNYADALTLRAVLALNHQNAQAAITDLDAAIKADPNYGMAYMVMGSALNMLAKYDEAIRALERGESLAPNYWQAQFEMGKAYIGKGDYPAALQHLQRAQGMTSAEYPLIYLLQAHALLAMKQYPEAMNALQAYLQKDPKGPNSAEAQKLLQQTQAFVANGK
jgi:tetratricopeptide (TPR) repeat protein